MRKLFVALLLVMTSLTLAGPAALADPGHPKKVTICHVAGLAEDPANTVTLTIGWHAVYGPAGHFSEPGTPNAGHEQDYEGPCDEVEPTPEPTEEPTDPPTDEPTDEPTYPPDRDDKGDKGGGKLPHVKGPNSDRDLAFTGVDPAPLVLVVAGLLGAALGMFWLSNRRARG